MARSVLVLAVTTLFLGVTFQEGIVFFITIQEIRENHFEIKEINKLLCVYAV